MNLILPWPPSSNRYWRNYRGHVVMSEDARVYKTAVGWQCQFDAAVNSGVGQAATFLGASGGDFVEYMGQRIAWYAGLSNWELFGRGWVRRCADLLKEAA